MPQKLIIHNPGSGSGDHGESVRRRADELGYILEQSETAGDAVTLAAEAAEAGFSTVVAGGGDGTVNEVVQGIDRAGALEDVELGILPLGTGNNFAEQIGVPDLDTAFAVLEDGDRRRIDLGYASDRPFVNSCVAGLTAESSSETPSEMKRQLGVLAYVLTTLRTVSDFESLRLTVDIGDAGQETPARRRPRGPVMPSVYWSGTVAGFRPVEPVRPIWKTASSMSLLSKMSRRWI
jgi:YegS/Rv2252/BmrU family lipid kinase